MDFITRNYTQLRGMFTSSPINFAILSFLACGFVCRKFKFSSTFVKIVLLSCIAILLTAEVFTSAREKDNQLKFLGITQDTTLSEFNTIVRNLKAKYHPDSATGNNDLFLRVNELYEGLSVDYKRKVEAYTWFGELYDLTRSQRVTGSEISNLELSRGVALVTDYIMILLVTLMFYQDSAKRGLRQKILVSVIFFGMFITDMVIGYKIELEDSSSFDFSSLLREWLDCPFATIVELSNVWRLLMVVILVVIYCYGIMFQLKTDERLLLQADRYYLAVHSAGRKIEKAFGGDNRRFIPTAEPRLNTQSYFNPGSNYAARPSVDSKSIDNCKRKLTDLHKLVDNVINEQSKSQNFFKTFKKYHSIIYYLLIGGLIGFQLYSKHS